MSTTPREIGTLVVVILKAKHLPNKRHIGKQDPYCAVTFNGEKRRTRAIKRGGQHPEWDEEVRFELYEVVEDELDPTVNGVDTPPPPPPKNDKGPRKIKGGKSMRLSCYADDPREPDLIGESMVDLTEVLTKGETDEWFTLMNKEKYCGEVYLELTFWLNEKPPEKKPRKPTLNNRQYGGPGSFIPSGQRPPSPHNDGFQEGNHRESFPESLRTSHSLAKLDLYVPPYEKNSHGNHMSAVEGVANDFGELGISDHRRRGSFPPLHDSHTPRSSSTTGFSTLSSHAFEDSTHPSGGSAFGYDNRPTTPTGDPLSHQGTISGSYGVHSYQPPYENTSSPSSLSHPSATRAPRYSIPTSSSGFVPLPTPAPGFPTLYHSSEPSGFPPPAHTPAPLGYHPAHNNHHPGLVHVSSQTSLPSALAPPIPPSSSAGFHQTFPVPQSTFQYPNGVHQPPASAPPQQYVLPSQLPPALPSSQSAPSQPYQGYSPTPPAHENVPPPPPPPQANSLSSSVGSGSRPLPLQPHSHNQPQSLRHPSYSLPPLPTGSHHLGPHSPTHPSSVVFPPANPYPPVPPPPSLPSELPSNSVHQPYPTNIQQSRIGHPGPPPPPPPPPTLFKNSPSRRASLPQPPVSYQKQQPVFLPVPPPPPPPPIDFSRTPITQSGFPHNDQHPHLSP